MHAHDSATEAAQLLRQRPGKLRVLPEVQPLQVRERPNRRGDTREPVPPKVELGEASREVCDSGDGVVGRCEDGEDRQVSQGRWERARDVVRSESPEGSK